MVSSGDFLVGSFTGACLASAEPPQAPARSGHRWCLCWLPREAPSSGLRSQVGTDNQTNGTDLFFGGRGVQVPPHSGMVNTLDLALAAAWPLVRHRGNLVLGEKGLFCCFKPSGLLKLRVDWPHYGFGK